MAEDAKTIARRIVQDVLAAHEQAQAAASAVDGSTDDRSEGPPPLPSAALSIDGSADTATPDRVADVVDDSPARQLARRIVAEVLEAHARADRDAAADQPAVGEGEGPGVRAVAPTLQPAEGNAVLPATPEQVLVDPTEEVTADEATAIARRIVASVLAEAGPPPESATVRQVDDPALAETVEPTPAAPDEDPNLQAQGEAAPDLPQEGDRDAVEIVDAPALDEPLFATITADRAGSDDVELDDLEPDAPEPDAPEPDEQALFDLDEDDPVQDDPAFDDPRFDDRRLDDAPADEPSPESTAVLPADGDADPDLTTRVPVATLERDDADAEATRSVPVIDEPTVAIPADQPKRRTGRWLLATVLGIGALAILLPMAIEALRSLVALS